MFSKEDKGFTLVEVIVALAVVAIVSTSLFRLFITTSYVNREAELTDLAHTIAVGQAESFKSNPEAYPTEVRYFNKNGAWLPAPESGEIPTGSVIKTESTVTKPLNTSGNSTGYFPNFVGTIDLGPYADWDIEITPAGVIYCGKHKTTLELLAEQEGSRIKNNILPIKVEYSTGGVNLREIHVTNNSNLETAIYFFKKESGQSIDFNPVSGQLSITDIDPTSSATAKYNLNLEVSKLVKNVSYYMFTFSADEYVYH
ncbi:hypothetical protein DP73_16780 [Desulfosporosinus sp. HMP52]|uniref:type II secretion system protein n=1 Tax=Desulfosporosinus sp. HMP52 TaxID=1487923 RepID=UPI00051FBE80|nr:type II secretion system protein [Desulfosporosinus sp. HMP52]KGK86353.1 hypothetical protein DP73_16780 [Desulfosporosinus sp. HMP52]